MDSKAKSYIHLSEENLQDVSPNQYMPIVPHPFHVNFSLFGRPRTFICGCGDEFKSDSEYQLHYRVQQMIEMNNNFQRAYNLVSYKATFNRRVAYVYRWGTRSEVVILEMTFDKAGWGEGKTSSEMLQLNATLEHIWGPVMDRQKKLAESENENKDDGLDDGDVEDQSAAEAKADFAEPFTVVNSKGVTYYLNMKECKLRGGKMVPIWYFTKEFRPETGQRALPEGYIVNENSRNGFVTIRRPDGTDPGGQKAK